MPLSSIGLRGVRQGGARVGGHRVGWALALALACVGCRGSSGPADAHEASPDEAATAPAPAVAPRLAPVASVGTADAWLDLVAQRPGAVVMRDGRLLVELGEPAALRHLELARGIPWRIGEAVEGRNAAVLLGRSGTFTLPLDGALSPGFQAASAPQEATAEAGSTGGADVTSKAGAAKGGPEVPRLAVALTLRALAPDQMVTVLWNETPIVNLRVPERWERRTVSIPPELARPGENRMRLHFRHVAPYRAEADQAGPPVAGGGAGEAVSAAVELVELGTTDAIRAGTPPRETYRVEQRGDGGTSVRLAGGSSLVYYLVPPRRARLRIDVSGEGGLELLASTDADHLAGRAPNALHRAALRGEGRTAEIDLSGYAGVPTRLELRVLGGEGPAAAHADFRELAVTARRSVPLDRRRRAPRDLYVIGIEGARHDDLVRLREHDAPMPHLDRMLRESLVFERAYTLGSAAVPSHAAWLSSTVPPAHLTVRGTFVAEGRTMLPEVLDRAGYFNAGVSANADVDRERGLVQGFGDHQVLRRGPTKANTAVGVMARVLEQVASRPSPRFVYAVVSDPQAPYDPSQEVFREPLSVPEGAPAQHLTHMWVSRVRRQRQEVEGAQLDYVRRLYRGELQVVDAAIGALISALEARDELDEAVVVIMGIHGEEFLEHGRAGHGHALHEELIHVPLMIRAPKLLAAGRVDAPVDLLDLGPTLLDLLGLDFPSDWQGESLIPVIDDPQPSPRLVVSYLGDGSRAAVVGDYKLVLGPGRGPEAESFFDLGQGEGESLDLGDEGGIALRVVRTALAWQLQYEDRWKRARWGTGANLRPSFALDHGL